MKTLKSTISLSSLSGSGDPGYPETSHVDASISIQLEPSSLMANGQWPIISYPKHARGVLNVGTEEMILNMFFQCGFQRLNLKTLLEDGLQPVSTLST